jgi:hypothetical protein
VAVGVAWVMGLSREQDNSHTFICVTHFTLQSINNISDYNTPVLQNPMLLQPKPFTIFNKTVTHTKNFLYIL